MPRLQTEYVLGYVPAEFAFAVVQTDAGTYPTADANNDTLTLTSSDGSILITGSAATDTVDLTVTGTSVGGFTAGSVIFAGATGKLAQDNTNFFWDNTNDFLGVGTNAPAARLHLAGNTTAAAWTTGGIGLRIAAATYTDSSSSGTVGSMGVHAIAAPTVAASNSVTYTNAATLYIANAPTAGSNVTLTSPLSIWVDNGNVQFDGGIGAGGFGGGTSSSAKFNFGIAHSLAAVSWGVSGVGLRLNAGTVTDTTTADGATVATASIHSILRPTLAATNASSGITYTTSATLYIANSPTTSGAVTITNPLSLQVAAGNVIFNGALGVGASVSANTELFQLNGNYSASAWTTGGIRFRAVGRTYTDTSSSGTVATVTVDAFQRPTLAASNTVTFTTAATVLITNGPVAGTNVTITNPLALLVDDGDVRMDAKLICNSNSNNPTAAFSVLNIGISASAWGTSGIWTRFTTGIATDSSTADGATVTNAVFHSRSIGTLNATNAATGITYTHVASWYLQGATTAGSNVNITNNYAAWIDAGNVRIDGDVGIGSAMAAVPTAVLQINGAKTASAWGVNGIRIRVAAATFTDSSSSGTVTNQVVDGWGRPTLVASSATTYTNSSTWYVANSPLSSTNVTQTNSYALWVDDGISRLDGNVQIGCTGTAQSALAVAGSNSRKRTATATSYTILVTDYYIGVTSKIGRAHV